MGREDQGEPSSQEGSGGGGRRGRAENIDIINKQTKIMVVVVNVVWLEISHEYDGVGVDDDTCIVVVVGGGVAGREGRTGGRDGEGVSLIYFH